MFPDAASRSAGLHRRASQVIPDGLSRGTLLINPYPVYVASGQGAWVTDVDGNRYLDVNNNYTSIILGHADQRISDAVAAQLAKGSAFSMATEAEIELAELICGRVRSIERIRFCNSGTEAVMMAIKAARAFTAKPVIAKIEGSYHGAYDHVEVSLDAGPDNWGEPSRPNSVPYAIGTPPSVRLETVVLPFNDAETARRLIAEHADRLAAVIIDTMPSRVGMVPIDPAFLDAITTTARHLTASGNPVLVVADEVITFRLGPGGNQEIVGLQPDLTALAKVIGGGFPVGAVGGRAEVMAVFEAVEGGRPALPAGGTFSANSVTMAAGVACLNQLDTTAFARLDELGELVRSGVRAGFEARGFDGSVTGAGSLFRMHPHGRRVRSYRDARHSPSEARFMTQVHRELLNRGVYLTTYGMGCLSLAMSDDDIGHLVSAVDDAFAAVLDDVGSPG